MIWALTVTATLKIREQVFFAPLFQVWSQKVNRSRRYHPDKKDGQVISVYPLSTPHLLVGGGGLIIQGLLQYYRYL